MQIGTKVKALRYEPETGATVLERGTVAGVEHDGSRQVSVTVEFSDGQRERKCPEYVEAV